MYGNALLGMCVGMLILHVCGNAMVYMCDWEPLALHGCGNAFVCKWVGTIDLKRITRCKLALIFTSADHRQFLGLFGSEAARL
jgi:hypothetical protein